VTEVRNQGKTQISHTFESDFSDRLLGQGDARNLPQSWVFHVEERFRSIDTEIAGEVGKQGVKLSIDYRWQ